MEPVKGSFYSTFAQPAMIALARAGNRGCRVDTTLRDKLAADARTRLDACVAALRAKLGRDVNPNSPKQMQELLYKELRLPEQRKPPSGGFPGSVTTDEEAVKKLRRLAPQHAEVLTLILDYRGLEKEIAEFSIALEVRDGESYFVTSYNATGACTGRISSSQLIPYQLGGNLQNQRRGPTRRQFVARKGMRFVKADGSQAEARAVAARAGDTAWLERFADPKYDVHIENAAFVYSIPESLVLEEKKLEPAARVEWLRAHGLPLGNPPYVDSLRQRGKPVCHGANYMGGPNVAVKMADVTYSEAKVGLERYTRARRCLQPWWDSVDAILHTTRMMANVWGRKRLFMGRLDQSTLREAVAFGPQSDVGDLINYAFMRLDEELRSLGAYPLLQAHDEIVVEAPVDVVPQAAALLRGYLETPLRYPSGIELVIPSEVKVGENWYDLTPFQG